MPETDQESNKKVLRELEGKNIGFITPYLLPVGRRPLVGTVACF